MGRACHEAFAAYFRSKGVGSKEFFFRSLGVMELRSQANCFAVNGSIFYILLTRQLVNWSTRQLVNWSTRQLVNWLTRQLVNSLTHHLFFTFLQKLFYVFLYL